MPINKNVPASEYTQYIRGRADIVSKKWAPPGFTDSLKNSMLLYSSIGRINGAQSAGPQAAGATILTYNADQGDSIVWNEQTFTKVASLSNYLYVGAIPSTSGAAPSHTSLIAVSVGSSATSIGDYAFYGCASLTSVTIPAVTSIGSVAFGGCISLVIVSLPAATSIGDYAFQYCSTLASVTMNSVKTIGAGAFQYCSTLASVTMNSVTGIGSNTFHGCTLLTTVSIPASVTGIGADAFSSSGLVLVYIADRQLGISSPGRNVDFYGSTVTTIQPT